MNIVKSSTRVGNLFDRMLDIFHILGNIIIALIAVMVTAGVLLRYFFGSAQGWIIEVTPWMLAYCVFFSASRLLKKGGHVRLEILINYLPPRAVMIMSMITSLLAAAICFIVAWYGTANILEYIEKGTLTVESVRVSKSVVLSFIPVGCFLLFIEFLRTTYRIWQGKTADNSSVDTSII